MTAATQDGTNRRSGGPCHLGGQFLSKEQVGQLHQLAQVYDVPVVCYGLRSDFRSDPFPGSAYLMVLADDIEEIKKI